MTVEVSGPPADLSGLVPKTLYDANTILVANADDAPLALTIGASTFLGRKSSGNIAAMTPTESRVELGLATTDTPAFAGLSLGTTPATTGVLRIPNAGHLTARNAANSADRQLIGLDSSNRVSLGASGDVIVTSNDIRPNTGGAGLYDIGAAGTEFRTFYGRNLDLSSDAAVRTIIAGTTNGLQIATGTTQKLGVYGATAIAQRSGAAQAAVATTASTQTTPFGYTTAAQADGVITLLNELRNWAVAQGWIKGSA